MRPGARRPPFFRIALPCVLLASAVGPARSDPRPATAAYASAGTCATCHQDIHKAWSTSPHARSATSPAWLEALRRAEEAAGDRDAARRACVWCHAPTTLLTDDRDLKLPVSREGITCDFCHTVAAVDITATDHPFVLEPGQVKRGPFDYAGGRVPGHEVAYSPLHRGPLLCAACHEYRNARGVAVLSNYSEWQAGPYPGLGVSCQDCHMALVPGARAVGTTPKRSLRLVNQHRLVGGSAMSMLATGLDLKIVSATVAGETAQVAVVVTNAAAGHSVPGGLPSKSLVLAVGAEGADGSLQNRQERVYRRVLGDERGLAMTTVVDMFLKSAAVKSDTRIKPKETRRESFSVALPSGSRTIIARLEYRDASDPRGAPTISTALEVKHRLGR